MLIMVMVLLAVVAANDRPAGFTPVELERAVFKLVMTDPEKYGRAYMEYAQLDAEEVISNSVKQHASRRRR